MVQWSLFTKPRSGWLVSSRNSVIWGRLNIGPFYLEYESLVSATPCCVHVYLQADNHSFCTRTYYANSLLANDDGYLMLTGYFVYLVVQCFFLNGPLPVGISM